MWQLAADDIDSLEVGASLYGAGGGGSTRTEAAILRQALAERGPVKVVELADLAPDCQTVSVAYAGSGTMFEERPMAGDELVRAVQRVERHMGIRVGAVACVAAAGSPLLLSVLAAVQLGLPLIDADSTGRAFASLVHTGYSLAGLSITPLALADATGGGLILSGLGPVDVERTVRAMIPSLGGWAIFAMRPHAVSELNAAMTAGTMSRTLEAGRLCREMDYRGLAERFGARELFHGKVVEVRRRILNTSTGLMATAVLEHSNAPGRMLRVEMQSEYLVALEDAKILACVPDLISVLECDTGEVVGVEKLRYGLWVRVLALPCFPGWRTPAGLALAGPRAFNYSFDYVRCESF